LISHFGWRSAFVILGAVIWIVALPLAFVVRNNPREMGLWPDGDTPTDESPREVDSTSASTEEAPEASPPADYTLKQALRSSPFWTLALSFFFFGIAHSTITVHTVPALTDAGIPVETAAVSIGLLTVVSILGRLSFGFLGDYASKRYLFMVAYILMGFGVGFGGTVPLMPAIRADYFGRAALGKIQGFMNPVMMLAGAIGPIFAGYVFDTTGSYRISFMVTGSLTFCAAIAMFFARPAKPDQEIGFREAHP
jgi:sugar phosphate permease